ncbi:hypothetical protein ACIQLK_04855 [Microbacterium sp. NPDC091382]|uniref:hypothetical protein n=1 Tax=Microbacterium sp. NPDC091382 TaxID=3364210 RepID=UPI00382EA7AF
MSDPQDAGRPGEPIQSEPAMSQNPADVAQKVDGIVVQTRADLAGQDGVDGASVLARRLSDAGIDLTDDEMAAAVARVHA